MPSLMLRDLPAELVEQVRAYARANSLGLPAAAQQLLRLGLEADRRIGELQAIVDQIRQRPARD
jgi:hypothetical protein